MAAMWIRKMDSRVIFKFLACAREKVHREDFEDGDKLS